MESHSILKTPSKTVMRLSAAIGSLAIAASFLIGIGQSSFGLPFLVMFAVVGSWLYTDYLGWIRFNRYVAYTLMIAGAIWAIWDYLRAGASEQLSSVATLLVYVQLPLFFQPKSRRIYEQIGVFLILEFVVAALVNDNVLFGFLLVPALAFGCWTLVLFALYSAEEQVGFKKNSTMKVSELFRSLLWPNLEVPVASWMKGEPKTDLDRAPQNAVGFLGVGLPLSFVSLLLSAAYFYVLPRLNDGAYGSGGFGQPTVGFSDELKLDQMGQLLQSDKAVLRVEFQHQDGRIFRPFEPPYLRGAALAHYRFNQLQGIWQSGTYSSSLNRTRVPVPDQQMARESFVESTEGIVARFSEQANTDGLAITIAPFFRIGEVGNFDFDEDTWQIKERNSSGSNRRRYDLLVQGFDRGVQSTFIPESEDVLESEAQANPTKAPPPYEDFTQAQLDTLLSFQGVRFHEMLKVRDRVLEKNNARNGSVVDQALMLEDHLANSNEYQYTLDLTMERDRFLDPCEDFIRNQKKGHCQMFAATFAMMIRSLNVPSRIVTGYRPNEYNNVGNYFLVRQLHAHAWVEVYFTREQFDKSLTLKLPPQYNRGAWVRFDPTPPGNGSNAGGTLRPPEQQTFDFAQQLWKDYVMNVDRSSRSDLFDVFGNTSGGAYQRYILQIQAWMLKMQQGQFVAGFLSLDRWLSWQGGIFLAILVAISVYLWRFGYLLNPKRLWNWLARRSMKDQRLKVSHATYARCIRALETLGFHRQKWQTHTEFAHQVTRDLASQLQVCQLDFPFETLTKNYCRYRYGGKNDLDGKIFEEMDTDAMNVEKVAVWIREHQGNS